MKLHQILSLSAAVLFLTGCRLHRVAVQDGLKTKIYDAQTKEPLENAFTFYLPGDSSKHARSNRNGDILLKPKRRLELVTFPGMLDDGWLTGQLGRQLWVCKEGYNPFLVGGSGYYAPPERYQPDSIALTKSLLPPTKSCTDEQALSSANERYQEQMQHETKQTP